MYERIYAVVRSMSARGSRNGYGRWSRARGRRTNPAVQFASRALVDVGAAREERAVPIGLTPAVDSEDGQHAAGAGIAGVEDVDGRVARRLSGQFQLPIRFDEP